MLEESFIASVSPKGSAKSTGKSFSPSSSVSKILPTCQTCEKKFVIQDSAGYIDKQEEIHPNKSCSKVKYAPEAPIAVISSSQERKLLSSFFRSFFSWMAPSRSKSDEVDDCIFEMTLDSAIESLSKTRKQPAVHIPRLDLSPENLSEAYRRNAGFHPNMTTAVVFPPRNGFKEFSQSSTWEIQQFSSENALFREDFDTSFFAAVNSSYDTSDRPLFF